MLMAKTLRLSHCISLVLADTSQLCDFYFCRLLCTLSVSYWIPDQSITSSWMSMMLRLLSTDMLAGSVPPTLPHWSNIITASSS